jgi:arsenate reductase
LTIRIYHNPRCSKSRATLALIREQGLEPEIVEYLAEPPSAHELDRILGLLGREPEEIMRKQEAPYRDLGLIEECGQRRQALIRAMIENPILIERPIVVVDDRAAAIGRPPEAVLDILPKAAKKARKAG